MLLREYILPLFSSLIIMLTFSTCDSDPVSQKPDPEPSVEIASIEISPEKPQVIVGDTIRLEATVKDKSGAILTNVNVSWRTLNTSIASITSTGMLIGKKEGTVNVRAEVEEQFAEVQAKVFQSHIKLVEIVPDQFQLLVKDTVSLSIKITDISDNIVTDAQIKWSILDSSIASVSTDGILKGKSVGSTQIKAEVEGKVGVAQVDVNTRIATIKIMPEEIITWEQETTFLTVEIEHVRGGLINDAQIKWSIGSQNIIAINNEIDLNATLIALSNGITEVAVSTEGHSDTARVQVNSTLKGKVITADNNPAENFRFYFKNDSFFDSTFIDHTGSFEMKLSTPESELIGDFYFDSINRFDGNYHPSMKLSDTLSTTEEIRAVLVPRKWKILAGEFAGLELELSLQTVFSFPNFGDKGNYYSNWHTHRVKYVSGDLDGAKTVAWPEWAFPIEVFFWHTGNTQWGPRTPIPPQDSIAFWNNMEIMEQRFGIDLFKPANRLTLQADTLSGKIIYPYVIGAEVVQSIGVNGFGGAQSPCGFSNEACSKYDRNDLFIGSITIKSLERLSNRVAQHEMIHALGFGHSCFPSSNVRCQGDFPFQNLPTIVNDDLVTEYDVAYIQLLWAVHKAILNIDSNFDLIEAYQGERVLELELDPLPEWWLKGGPRP